MGSVKDLIKDDSPVGFLYVSPLSNGWGVGAWQVKGTFSVADLKELIPPTVIKNKAEALAMINGAFFEWLSQHYPDIPHCYLGVLDKDGKTTSVDELLRKGDLSSVVVMKLAHVPDTYSNGDLDIYRQALASGELMNGVADVESIFRKGFPLGSSTFKRIFKAVGKGKEYETLATYDETAAGLKEIRAMVEEKGLSSFPELEEILNDSGIGTTIPNPGYVLKDFVYDTTTKFEKAGDRDISAEEAKKLSGLNEEGYDLWAQEMFPTFARAQIEFCDERNILNIDGKGECVAYKKMPVVTDFACTPDENRLMITVNLGGVTWAIPSNKEIQRAIFRREGVYAAVDKAKEIAKKAGDINKWKDWMLTVLENQGINLKEVTEHSCNLMAYAIAEVGNRILGKTVFDAQPVDKWVREFTPYASPIERQE